MLLSIKTGTGGRHGIRCDCVRESRAGDIAREAKEGRSQNSGYRKVGLRESDKKFVRLSRGLSGCFGCPYYAYNRRSEGYIIPGMAEKEMYVSEAFAMGRNAMEQGVAGKKDECRGAGRRSSEENPQKKSKGF